MELQLEAMHFQGRPSIHPGLFGVCHLQVYESSPSSPTSFRGVFTPYATAHSQSYLHTQWILSLVSLSLKAHYHCWQILQGLSTGTSEEPSYCLWTQIKICLPGTLNYWKIMVINSSREYERPSSPSSVFQWVCHPWIKIQEISLWNSVCPHLDFLLFKMYISH